MSNKIFNTGTDKGPGDEQILEELDRINTTQKNRELYYAVNDNNLWEFNKALRATKQSGKHMRRIATIPLALYSAIEKKYGKQVFKDKKLFKEALEREESLRWGLVVPKNSL